jgi:hypothetical protein
MAKKKIFIFGNKGNMATRYKFYLEYLGCKVTGYDKDEAFDLSELISSDGVMICTPTNHHIDDLFYLHMHHPKKPILCEKAISTSIPEVETICNTDLNLRMINQYEYWANYFEPSAATHYNYFRHGGDGLAFDCINIIGLANASCKLDESSPIWSCAINGKRLSLDDMDRAYIWNLSDWLLKEDENKDYIRHVHRKVYQWING